MRWTTARALCRRLTVATVTLAMVTGSFPAGAFAEVLTTDSTFVQTDVDQVDAADAAAADAAPDADAADPAPDAGAADPTVLDTGDAPTPSASEIASAAGLTGAGQTESTPAGTLATDLVEGKELAEQQKQEETAEAEATWNEGLGLWMTSKGATGVKDEYDDGYVAGEQTPAQYYFSIDSLTNEISIEYGDAGITTLEVPSTIDDKNVVSLTGMGSAALTSITFAPNSHVRSVGGLGGSSIKEIALPDSVEELKSYAFYKSKTLQTVTWPLRNVNNLTTRWWQRCRLRSKLSTILHSPIAACHSSMSRTQQCSPLRRSMCRARWSGLSAMPLTGARMCRR